MSTPPKTADELLALVKSLLANLSPKHQQRFWMLTCEQWDNKHHLKVLDFFGDATKRLMGIMKEMVGDFVENTNDLARQLKKHRRPVKNAARDAEIMRLHGEKKTAGQIVKALQTRFQLTDKQVNAVISRQRKKPIEDE